MRSFVLTLVALATISTSAAHAQTPAPTVKAGVILVSSDGKRIGRIDRIEKNRAGKEIASVIYDAHLVYIPVDTLTMGEDGRAMTTLSRKEVSARR